MRLRKIIAIALPVVLLSTVGPAPARAAAANEVSVFSTALAARGAAVDVNYSVACPAAFTGTAAVSLMQTRDDGLIASGAIVDDLTCSNGGVLHLTRITANALGAPFERGPARLTLLATGADLINQNTRLQN